VAQRRGFQGRIPTRGKRRTTAWGLGPNAVALSIASNAAQIWTNGITLVAEEEVTLVRTRGEVQIFLTSVTAIGDGFHGAVGIGVVTEQAFAAGVGSVPSPFDNAEWDGWLWHSFFNVHQRTSTEGDGVNDTCGHIRIPIDSKAMRKWTSEQVIIGVVDQFEDGIAVMEVFVDCRMLVKLS